MPLTSEDRLSIADLVALHGHLFDEGELDRLDELFTADTVARAAAGWRISHRHLQARRHPLNGLGTKSEPLR